MLHGTQSGSRRLSVHGTETIIRTTARTLTAAGAWLEVDLAPTGARPTGSVRLLPIGPAIERAQDLDAEDRFDHHGAAQPRRPDMRPDRGPVPPLAEVLLAAERAGLDLPTITAAWRHHARRRTILRDPAQIHAYHATVTRLLHVAAKSGRPDADPAVAVQR